MVARQLHPADRVAVAYLAGTGAELVVGFTRDPREIGTALDVISAILDAKPEKVREHLTELAALRGAGDSLLPHLLAERYGSAGAVALLGGTGTQGMGGGGWALNALDVEGIPSAFGGSDAWGGGGAPGDPAAPTSGPGFDAEALFYVSKETGGMLFENFNHADEATETFLERTRLTYVLTIRSGELRPDGRLHRIEVRLREPASGTQLFHRTGYYAPRPDAERSDLERRMETAERILGEEQLDQLGARLRPRARPPEDGAATAELLVEIPGDRLLAGRTEGNVDLDLQIYAVDFHEGVQGVWLRRLTLDLEKLAPRIAGNRLQVPASLTLPEGRYRLRMLARDLSTGRVSLTTTPLTLPAEPAGSAARRAPGR